MRNSSFPKIDFRVLGILVTVLTVCLPKIASADVVGDPSTSVLPDIIGSGDSSIAVVPAPVVPPTVQTPVSPDPGGDKSHRGMCAQAVADLKDTLECKLDEKGSSAQQALQMSQTLIAGAAMSPALACSQFESTALPILSAGVSFYQRSCSTAVEKCRQACAIKTWKQDPKFKTAEATARSTASTPGSTIWTNFQLEVTNVRDELNENNAVCQKYEDGMPNMLATLTVLMSTMMKAQQACAMVKQQIATLQAEKCALNPNQAGCAGYAAGDCNNPANNSQACICYRNPVACANTAASNNGLGNAGYTPGGAGGPAFGGSSPAGGPGGGYTNPTQLYGQNQPVTGGAPPPTAGQTPPNNSGATGPGGGTAPVGSGKQAAVAKVSAPQKAIYGGYMGSGNGSSTTGGSGYGANDPSAKKAVFGGALAQGDPSLSRFAPGPYDPQRGLAGVSGPDGITGPNSDIWEKINTQYSLQHQRGSFLGQ